eukprot:5355216-Pleurochrysis_carterae.AAC.5
MRDGVGPEGGWSSAGHKLVDVRWASCGVDAFVREELSESSGEELARIVAVKRYGCPLRVWA